MAFLCTIYSFSEEDDKVIVFPPYRSSFLKLIKKVKREPVVVDVRTYNNFMPRYNISLPH